MAVFSAAFVNAADVSKPAPCTSQEMRSGQVTISASFSGNKVVVSPVKACVAPGTVLRWAPASQQEDFEATFADDNHCPFKPAASGHRQLKHTRATSPGFAVDCKTTDRNFDKSLNGCWSRYAFRYKTADGKFHNADPDVIVSPPSDSGRN